MTRSYNITNTDNVDTTRYYNITNTDNARYNKILKYKKHR